MSDNSFDCSPAVISDHHASMIHDIFAALEEVRDSGFRGVTSTSLTSMIGRNNGDGYLSATLWMLQDSGYVYAFRVAMNGSRWTVWSLDNIAPQHESEVF